MAKRVLKYNMRKDMIHEERRSSRVDPALVPVLALLAQETNVSGCLHKSSSLMEKALEFWVYKHRDLYMPQRTE